MDQQHCIACLYFCQHYIPWTQGRFLPVEYGHCIYGRTKMCRAKRPACQHFHPKEETQCREQL